jgi:hypothetical protein
MFKMLVFLIAAPQVVVMCWFALLLLSAGDFGSGLPLASLALMSFSYLGQGFKETLEHIKAGLKQSA